MNKILWTCKGCDFTGLFLFSIKSRKSTHQKENCKTVGIESSNVYGFYIFLFCTFQPDETKEVKGGSITSPMWINDLKKHEKLGKF